MTRLNLLMLATAVLCALGVVTSQHKARKLYMELDHQQELQRQLDIEWGQLQLEQSTWAMHSRVDKIARERLAMQVPEPRRITLLAAPAQRKRP